MEKKMVSAWVLLTCGAIVADGSLWELNTMIKQVTGKSAIFSYSTYGCHCGIGGKGIPKDPTDWCCHQHDCCYKRLEFWGLCNPKTDTYRYDYWGGKVHCDGTTWCKRENCECDRIFVECLQRRAHSYRTTYTYYPNIFCRGGTPQCSLSL